MRLLAGTVPSNESSVPELLIPRVGQLAKFPESLGQSLAIVSGIVKLSLSGPIPDV